MAAAISSFGNTGGNVGGVRVGGTTGYQSAFSVVGARKYRDFRDDRVMDNRQFQQALRRLRQFSAKLDIPKTELDLNGTIDKTCNHGGLLHIVMEKPRKNSVKLLLLMDSGGTMIPYTTLLNDLFQSVTKSNHFKEVKVYFFHNCIYSHLYKTPECDNGDWIETEWMFRNLDSDYKVIIVGDAAMAPEELYSDSGNYRGPNGGLSGFEWLNLMKRHYKKIVWLNPKMAPGHAPWREAETAIMAGMGGMLIVHILEDSPEVVDSLQELVLSPQRDFHEVRRYLHKIGFSIKEEHMLKEDNKPYVLMRCEKGEETYDREIDYLYGKLLLEKKDPVLKELILHEEGKYSRLFENLKCNPTENARKRLPEVEEKLALMREALACL